MVLLLVALVLFILSVFADRVLHSDTLAKWLFVFLWLPLFGSILFFVLDLVLGTPPFGLSIIDFFKWVVLKFGGWSQLFAALYFSSAIAVGVMFLLSWFIDAVEPWWYGFGALFCLVCGIVFLLGFFVFFEGMALILGIASTIIGIIVGLRKLYAQNSE